MTLRILLLAGLDEPLTGDSRGDAAALAFELATGLAVCAADTGELAVDLVARRGSRTPLPLVSVDPSELAPVSGFAAAEALLCQVALSGLLEGYDVVHSLLPAVAVLQIAAAHGSAIVQTVAGRRGAAAADVIARVVDARRLAQVRDLPAGVDLTRFRPAETTRDEYLLWLGSGGAAGETAAKAIAAALALPLRTFDDGDVVTLLQHARALLHLAPRATAFGSVWPLRALACGTAVVGWSGAGLDALVPEPILGALAGDLETLIARARVLPPRDAIAAARRELCLARHGSRAMVARYREVYRELASAA